VPEILDQSEVDALLKAVEDGTVQTGGGGGAKQDEDEEPRGDVALYDFKRPEKVSKDQSRSFEMLHEFYARNLSGALSALLRSIVEVRLVSVEELTYSEFIMSLPNPTCFNLLSCEPLEGNIILEINPAMTFRITGRLLGGGKTTSAIPDRPFTEIENTLIGTIVDRALEQLKVSWMTIKEINFKVVERESNPLLMQVVAPNEPVVLICFEMTMGEHTGTMNLCLPFRVIEPVINEFAAHAYYSMSGKRQTQDLTRNIQDSVERAPVNAAVFVAETQLKLRDILNLEVGDIIATNREAKLPMLMFVEGLPKFQVSAGVYRGHRAVRILGLADKEDPFHVAQA
jgi:flagellar motor switch protein FliM